MTKTHKLLRELEEAAETAKQLRDEYEGTDDVKRARLRWYAQYLSGLTTAAHNEFGYTERIGA